MSEKESSIHVISESEKILGDIIALLPGHIYWKNIDGVYLGCNELQAKNLGISQKEIIGKTDFDITPDTEMAKKFRESDLRVIHTGQGISVEEEVFILGKRAIMMSEKVPLRNEEGNIIGILGISHDITDLRNAQNQLKKIEGLLDGMTLLSAGISHELKTPLAAIAMTSHGLKAYMPTLISAYKLLRDKGDDVEYIPDDALQLITYGMDRIEKAAKSSSQTINMMLTNLIAEKSGSIKRELCSIRDCIINSIEEYTYPLGSKDKINIDHVQDFKFHGEPNLVKCIFFNLMKNAFYFIEKTGKGEITVWTDCASDYNRVYFKDTGLGISEEQLPRIFDRFYTHNTHHGTGVGLAFCKEIMQKMGGEITCESTFGEYTQFILSFPKLKGNG